MKNNYLVILLSIVLLLTFIPIKSQVGIGTTNPRGVLDLNSLLTNTLGLVLPTNSSTSHMINPQGGLVAEGTLMYDSTNKCVKYFNGTSWSNCLCDSCGNSTPSVVADCSQGFAGTYRQGIALSGATYRVTLTNNSFSNANLTFQTGDLVLNGVTVASVTPTTTNIAPGASQVITYTLSGTPQSDGTLSAAWNKITLSCNNTVNIQRSIRFGLFGTGHFLQGTSDLTNYRSQLTNPVNYGPTGTYITNSQFVFSTSTPATHTGAQLKQNYDILSVYVNNIGNSQIIIDNLKSFA